MKHFNVIIVLWLASLLSCRGTTPTLTSTTEDKTSILQEKKEKHQSEQTANAPAVQEIKTTEGHTQLQSNTHTMAAPEQQDKTTNATQVNPQAHAAVGTSTASHSVPQSDSHASHHTALGTDPETALRWLKNGNRRFIKGFLRNDGATFKDIKRLSAGQKPHSVVLSCSDSRVPPEVIFDQKLGEIFTVRTAGEVVEPGVIGTIEYAVEHLGVRNLLVLGHTNCGAVKAALSTLEGKDAGSNNLNHLVQDIHPRLEQFKDRSPSGNFVEEGWANVNGVVKDLMKRSKILEEKIKSGALKINSGVYDLETGMVDFR